MRSKKSRLADVQVSMICTLQLLFGLGVHALHSSQLPRPCLLVRNIHVQTSEMRPTLVECLLPEWMWQRLLSVQLCRVMLQDGDRRGHSLCPTATKDESDVIRDSGMQVTMQTMLRSHRHGEGLGTVRADVQGARALQGLRVIQQTLWRYHFDHWISPFAALRNVRVIELISVARSSM